MPAGNVLKNILSFTGLLVGVPVSQPHLICINSVGKIPQTLAADEEGFILTADATNVTVTRTANATTGSVNILVERWHTIEDVEPPGGLSASFPFVYAADGGGGGGGGGVAVQAGTQTATNGTVNFANSNGMTFGMSASSQVTASFQAVRALTAGTTNATGSGLSFADGNGVSFGLNGNTLTASVAAGGGGGVAISASNSSQGTGTISFANGGNVSFGLSNGTITASVNAAVESVSAGTTFATGPSVLFQNSNGQSFGVNGNTVTASFDAVRRISAGTTLAAGSQVVFADGNGVSFGVNGSTITASIAAGAGFAFSAGTQSQSTGTISFSNANGLSMGLSNGTLTGAIGAIRSMAFIGGGTIADSVTFSNASGVSFITNATNGRVVNLVARAGYVGSLLQDPAQFAGTFEISNGGLSFYRSTGGAYVTATNFRVAASFTYDTAAATLTVTALFGVYTLSGSTASLASSFSQSFTNDLAFSASSNPRVFALTGATFSMTPGDYLVGVGLSWSNSTNMSSASMLGLNAPGRQVLFGPVTAHFINGYSISTTGAFPASINVTATNFVRTGSRANQQPSFMLIGS